MGGHRLMEEGRHQIFRIMGGFQSMVLGPLMGGGDNTVRSYGHCSEIESLFDLDFLPVKAFSDPLIQVPGHSGTI